MFERVFADALTRFLDPIPWSKDRTTETEPRPVWCERVAQTTMAQLYTRPAHPYGDTVYRDGKLAFLMRCDGDFLAGILNDRDDPITLVLWVEDEDATQRVVFTIPGRSFCTIPIVSIALKDQTFTFQVQDEPQVLCVPYLRFVFGVVNHTIFEHVRNNMTFHIDTFTHRFCHTDGRLTLVSNESCKDRGSL